MDTGKAGPTIAVFGELDALINRTHPECACVKSAQVQLVMLALLLKDDAARAKEIIFEYQPVFDSMQAYFDFVDKINIDQDAVIYEDGNITLNYGGNRCEKKSTSGTTPVSF